jgi:hypothetical protein
MSKFADFPNLAISKSPKNKIPVFSVVFYHKQEFLRRCYTTINGLFFCGYSIDD